MKKIIIIFALVYSQFFYIYGQRDKLDQLFDQYQEMKGVTSIKIAKPMFGMLSKLDIGDADINQIKPLLAKINGLKILITENPEGSRISNNLTQVNKDISTYLHQLNYSEIMSLNREGSKINFLSSEAKNGVIENMIVRIDSGSGENILVMLDGKLTMDDLNNIMSSSETVNNSTTTTQSQKLNGNTSYLNGEARNVGDFLGIQVSTGVNVVFTQDNNTSVKVIADADKLENIITKVEAGILKVYVDNKGKKNLKFKNLSVNVSSPNIESIKTFSGANFTVVKSINQKNMEIDASSGSAIVGEFAVNNALTMNVSSGSNVKAKINSAKIVLKSSSGSSVKLEGTSELGYFDISSGASCKADSLQTKDAFVEATSGSNISVNVQNNLKVKASSAGSVKYKGNPNIESSISKNSGGSLQQVN